MTLLPVVIYNALSSKDTKVELQTWIKVCQVQHVTFIIIILILITFKFIY